MSAAIQNATDALNYLRGGHGSFTLVSKKTGTRFTYRVRGGDDKPLFVSLLNGPDNTEDFMYIGFIPEDKLLWSKKSVVSKDSASFKALAWTLGKLQNGVMPENLEFWHDGSCARCGRALTVPESIEMGLGPVCATK